MNIKKPADDGYIPFVPAKEAGFDPNQRPLVNKKADSNTCHAALAGQAALDRRDRENPKVSEGVLGDRKNLFQEKSYEELLNDVIRPPTLGESINQNLNEALEHTLETILDLLQKKDVHV